MLSSVDIIDTAVTGQHTVIAGPPLNVGRCYFGMATIGNCLFAVGGSDGDDKRLASVEYLEFNSASVPTNNVNAHSLFPVNSNWTIHESLVVSQSPFFRSVAVASIGKCLIVAGAFKDSFDTVEVLDTERNVVWNLPRIMYNLNRMGTCWIVATSGEIVFVTGWSGFYSCERIPLVGIKGTA